MATKQINKYIRHAFELLETYEAGLVLRGSEVKSIKQGHIQLKGSYIKIEPNNTLWLIGAHVSQYKPAGKNHQHDPLRPKKLLLQKKEINRLRGKLAEKGLTIVPTKVYTKGGLIKLQIGLAKGLKKHDKREKIKKRDIDRDTKRLLKERFR
ncbi:MAG: SsrA-binding protein SmpB [Patescibacteria group bacterium]